MRKKLLSILLITGLLVSVVGSAYADLPANPKKRIKSYAVTADGAVASTSFNVNQDVMIGYTLIGLGAQVGVYDAATDDEASTTNIRCEAESIVAEGCATRWFTYPVSFTNQPMVIFNDTEINSDVVFIIHYVEDWAE